MLHNVVVLYRSTITFSYVVSTNRKSRLRIPTVRCLLEAMHKRLLEAARPKVPERSPRAETSFVWRVFGGCLRSQVTCKAGENTGVADNFFFSHPLPLWNPSLLELKGFPHVPTNQKGIIRGRP